MRFYPLLFAGFVLIAGLSAACSDSGGNSKSPRNPTPAAEEALIVPISDQLTPEEEALIALAEEDARSAIDPASLEIP